MDGRLRHGLVPKVLPLEDVSGTDRSVVTNTPPTVWAGYSPSSCDDAIGRQSSWQMEFV